MFEVFLVGCGCTGGRPTFRVDAVRFYRALSSLGWPRSYTGKILLVCFIGIHVPLITLTLVRLMQTDAAFAQWRSDLVLILAGTLAGTAGTLLALHGLLAPIRAAAAALDEYRADGTLPRLPTATGDEAARLMSGVQATLVALDQKVRQLDAEATTDALTGLLNRRGATQAATRELDRARRENIPVCVMMLDLDRFKSINDSYGHATGDAVLIVVGGVLRSELRPYDILARIGGEEFCVVLSGLDNVESSAVANRLRAAIHRSAYPGVPRERLSCSIGLVTSSDASLTLSALMRIADERLYEAKEQGRNRVVSHHAAASGGSAPNRAEPQSDPSI